MLLATEIPRRQSQLWRPTYTPSACHWWFESISGARDWEPYRGTPQATYTHFGALLDCIDGGRSANEAEGLDMCFRRVLDDGARSRTGLWCVCLTEATSAGEARGSIGGDSMAGLLAVKADLHYAVDQLPIGWSAVVHLYRVQGRELLYQARYRRWFRGESTRPQDVEREPLDPETGQLMGRSFVWYFLSWVLTCTPILARHACSRVCADQHRGEGIAWKWPRRDEVDTPMFQGMISSRRKLRTPVL